MKFFSFVAGLSLLSSVNSFSWDPVSGLAKRWGVLGAPKVVIISMFGPEAGIWYGPDVPWNLYTHNITVPGLSPIYPYLHCSKGYEVCQITIGEAECNAGPSLMALTLFPKLDLSKTYFMVAGIAGVNPEVGTLGSVGLSKFAVQVGLSYEIDAREKPENFSTGYIQFGGNTPLTYPGNFYGTEVFELNEALRDWAFNVSSGAKLNDSDVSVAYRAQYKNASVYAAGAAPPSVIKVDTLCSDVWFTGTLFSSMFGEYTTLITNGSGIYGFTAEEESATLESLLRAALYKLVDFSRIIVMRSASDIDRPPPGLTAYDNLFTDAGGFEPSLMNLYAVGEPIISGIIKGWSSKFKKGIKPTNYIGDIFGSLGGTPDFGPGRSAELPTNPPYKKRSLESMRAKRHPRSLE